LRQKVHADLRLPSAWGISPCQVTGWYTISAGKIVTGFANSDEATVGLTDVVPFLEEDELQKNGGIYSKGEASHQTEDRMNSKYPGKKHSIFSSLIPFKGLKAGDKVTLAGFGTFSDSERGDPRGVFRHMW